MSKRRLNRSIAHGAPSLDTSETAALRAGYAAAFASSVAQRLLDPNGCHKLAVELHENAARELNLAGLSDVVLGLPMNGKHVEMAMALTAGAAALEYIAQRATEHHNGPKAQEG